MIFSKTKGKIMILTDKFTSKERISSETGRTTAYRIVIDNLAQCLPATSTRTRINAFLVIASLIPRTI